MSHLKNKNFLVVDDEQATIDIVKEVLNRSGAKASGINSAEKSISMMKKDKYDAIILDRYMPVMDGHEVLSQIKKSKELQGIPVIMLTGENKQEEIKKSVQLGAAGYVIKPFTPKSFLAQVERILGPKNFEVDF